MQGNPLPFCHRKAMFFYCRGGLSILYRKGNEPLSNFPQRKTEEIVTPASQAHEDKIEKEEIAMLTSLAITDCGTETVTLPSAPLVFDKERSAR